jgi:DNA-binding NarL/FixJ family response regulator
LPGGTLFVSRKTAIFSWLKGAFVETGFRDITVTTFDKDALAFQLNELKPRHVFMDSAFYSGVTPYMIGKLLVKFPKLRIHIVNFGDFPDSLAMRFVFHGAKSYLDFRDGHDEFRAGLKKIFSGEDYYSQGVEAQFEEKNEMPKLTREVTDREWQVLFLVCNGFTEEKIAYNLAISRRTVDTHISNLHNILDAKKGGDLIRKALCLGWVKKEHLCFHGADIEIPHHPGRKRATRSNIAERRKTINF